MRSPLRAQPSAHRPALSRSHKRGGTRRPWAHTYASLNAQTADGFVFDVSSPPAPNGAYY